MQTITTDELRIDGKAISETPGWHKLADTLGAHFNPRLGWRLVTSQAFNGTIEWNGTKREHLGPRSIRTLRFGAEIPVPFYWDGNGGAAEDFRSGGMFGIDPCGAPGSVLDHDRRMARAPVALVDMETGKNRDRATIERPSGGPYMLDRIGALSVLPEYGETDERCSDGQHFIRMFTIGLRWKRDEFVAMDLAALAHDAAVAWDESRLDRILAGPEGLGTQECGREWSWVSIIAAASGNRGLAQRMIKIAQHTTTPLGNMQVLIEGEFFGNPLPWGDATLGGSQVPHSMNVFSSMEAHFEVQAKYALGLKDEASKLANVVLPNMLAKWIDCKTGKGAGVHGDNPWAAIPAIACGVFTPEKARTTLSSWQIPKPNYMGGTWGPFATVPEINAKLKQWGDLGKSRTAIAVTE